MAIELIERWTCSRCGQVHEQERGLTPPASWSGADFFGPQVLQTLSSAEDHTARANVAMAGKHFCPECTKIVEAVLQGVPE